MFKEVSQKIGDRPGGYTRILKTGNRLGDNAAMCFIELVDYNENMLKTATAKKATKTRRSRKKSTAAAETEAPVAEAPVAKKKLLNKFRLIQQTNKKSHVCLSADGLFAFYPEPDPNRQSQIEVHSSSQDLDNQGEENFQG